jgi:hypothetical protein
MYSNIALRAEKGKHIHRYPIVQNAMSNLKHEGAIKDGGMHGPNALRQHASPAGVHVGEEELLEAPPGLGLRPAEAVEPRQPRSAGLEPFRPQPQP